ncbi:hypothetical protein NLG97_g3905 [Lecanicillium saksenae]|uniref:Uncharacterized protein n=1 Tax=Lecanicillium saksenae TaxID=468837 RepID=A0ACC1QXZ9_9HYPO|nr:hypothetical protein NLG97_g3905 [Lecanicillium saksenae]
MRFSVPVITLLAAIPYSAAAPLDKRQQGGGFLSGITSLFGNLGGHTNGANYPKNSGGTGGVMADIQVPMDHMKYTFNPASAETAIPPEQNSQLREGHRMAHAELYKGFSGGAKEDP